MGKKPQKIDRAAFIAANPKCCYCNGRRSTAELDHAPARICFVKKEGPDGHIFPSCSECNRIAGLSEQVMAFYIRSFDQAAVEVDRDELDKLVTALVNNAPDAVPMFPERAKLGPNLLINGLYEADRTLTLTASAKDHIELFATKVLYALYYKATGNFAGSTNRYIVQWAQAGTERAQFLQARGDEWFDEHTVGCRPNVDLGNQFTYQTGYHPGHGFFGVRMSFADAFVMFGVIGPARPMAKLEGGPPLCPSILHLGKMLRKRHSRR